VSFIAQRHVDVNIRVGTEGEDDEAAPSFTVAADPADKGRRTVDDAGQTALHLAAAKGEWNLCLMPCYTARVPRVNRVISGWPCLW